SSTTGLKLHTTLNLVLVKLLEWYSAKLFFPLGNVLSIITIFIFKAEQMESGSNLTQTTSGRRSISLKRVSKNSRTNSKIKPVFSSNGKNGDKGMQKSPKQLLLYQRRLI